ncbi:hypothetical protein BH10BAC3_BH10BAC3_09920 [soil metagenome]
MKNLTVPKSKHVVLVDQAIFYNLNKALYFVPNLYVLIAHSDWYLSYQNAKTTLNNKEKEAVNIIVSKVTNFGIVKSHTL